LPTTLWGVTGIAITSPLLWANVKKGNNTAFLISKKLHSKEEGIKT